MSCLISRMSRRAMTHLKKQGDQGLCSFMFSREISRLLAAAATRVINSYLKTDPSQPHSWCVVERTLTQLRAGLVCLPIMGKTGKWEETGKLFYYSGFIKSQKCQYYFCGEGLLESALLHTLFSVQSNLWALHLIVHPLSSTPHQRHIGRGV